jgi:hypothetical protein
MTAPNLMKQEWTVVKTFMCIRRLEDDGETVKPMHCRSVSIVDYDALQAKLDAVMLEYCPEEMTDEQRANWTASQADGEGKP